MQKTRERSTHTTMTLEIDRESLQKRGLEIQVEDSGPLVHIIVSGPTCVIVPTLVSEMRAMFAPELGQDQANMITENIIRFAQREFLKSLLFSS